MMVNRNFFLGLGLGIIISSVIFYLSIIVINKTPVNDNKVVEISNEEIISRAKKLGMVPISSLPSTNQNPISDDEIIKKAADLGMVFITEEKPQETTQPTQIPTQQLQLVDVRITGGSSAESVSKTLYDAGLIEEVSSFTKYIKDNDKATKIRAGYFKINKGSTFDQILTILTTPPNK